MSTTTEETHRFFKEPVGYISAAVGVAVVVIIVGGLVGFLWWKRRQMIKSGKLKFVDEEI